MLKKIHPTLEKKTSVYQTVMSLKLPTGNTDWTHFGVLLNKSSICGLHMIFQLT